MRYGLSGLFVAALLLITATACGGGGDGISPSPSRTARPSPTPTAATPTAAAPTPTPSPPFASPAVCALAEPAPFPTVFPSVLPLGGGDELTPPTYLEGRLIKPGVSISRQLSEVEEARLLGAIEAVRVRASGEGEEINCIHVFGAYDDYVEFNDVCGGDKLGEFRDFEGLAFDYLPPGTYARSPQASAICPDGTVSGFGRGFMTCCDTFGVWFTPGPRGFSGGGVRGGQVYAATLGERPAVILLGGSYRPLRRGWIAMATETGTIIIDAGGLPLDEAVNIAVGIRCEIC